MKNKGFTLIELLAVIVILALIALVTIPMINNVIEKAKKGALEDSVYGLKSAAELYYSTTGTSETIEFDCTEEGCKTDDGKKLSFKGSVETGKVKLFSDGKVSICLTKDNYGSSILAGEKKVTTTTGGCDEETYKVSEVIAIEKYNDLEKELDNVKNEFSSVKTTLYNKTLISSVDNDTDTINEEIENVNLNQGEAANKKAIVEGLQYSGLGITEDMSWEEIKETLLNEYPKWDGLIYQSGNEYTDITGGIANMWSGGGTISKNSTSLSFNGNASGVFSGDNHYGMWSTKSKIDLTNINYIKLEGSYGSYATSRFGIAVMNDYISTSWLHSSNGTVKQSIHTGITSSVLDVSNLTGEYYIQFGCGETGGSYGTCYINKVYAE